MIDKPVHRRRVFFCTGYEPNGPKFFYNLFKREFERYGSRFGFAGNVTPLRTEASGFFSNWEVQLHGDDWTGQTRYTVLNWDDLVNKYMRRPMLVTLLLKVIYDLDAVITGTIWRIVRLNWRFGVASIYPSLALVGLLLSGLAAAFGVHSISQSWGIPTWANYALSALTAWGVPALGYSFLSRKCFFHLLITDGIFSFQHARGKRPDYVERVDQFARRLVETINESDDDEVLVVGHSSGSICAVEVLARALRIEPSLTEKGPRISLLTVGANLPLIGCHPCAEHFRADVALVAIQENLFWLEYQATEDLLNFLRFDPVRDLPSMELKGVQANPVVYSACMRKSFSPANYWRNRLNFFRVHYQFVMAIDRLVPCDYPMIVAGPASLETRGMDPQRAMEMCHGPDAWSGTQEELQPWVPLPVGRTQASQRTITPEQQTVHIKTTSTEVSERKTVVSNLLILLAAFLVGLAAAELPSSMIDALPVESQTLGAGDQPEAVELNAGPDDVVTSPTQRRPT